MCFRRKCDERRIAIYREATERLEMSHASHNIVLHDRPKMLDEFEGETVGIHGLLTVTTPNRIFDIIKTKRSLQEIFITNRNLFNV